MKRPDRKDYFDLNKTYETCQLEYAEALEKFIDYLEAKDLKCKKNFDCGIEYCELKKCTKFEMK